MEGGTEPGKQIVNLIIDRLVNDGTYDVVESARMKEKLNVQDTTRDERRNQSTAAKTGQLVNASVVVMGSVNEFGVLDAFLIWFLQPCSAFVRPRLSFGRTQSADGQTPRKRFVLSVCSYMVKTALKTFPSGSRRRPAL
ncbi:MAG: CsgG/HfaB family protein [Pyrinomonadaceae bacterium]